MTQVLPGGDVKIEGTNTATDDCEDQNSPKNGTRTTQSGPMVIDSGEHGIHTRNSGELASCDEGHRRVKVCNQNFVSVPDPPGETHRTLSDDVDVCTRKRTASDRDLNVGIRKIGMKMAELAVPSTEKETTLMDERGVTRLESELTR